ncbi:MAG: PilZ domain-containing protein [Magnetococcales bacterium]|nr:PilZ domain-containing protein [Magnetococcales bacterium]
MVNPRIPVKIVAELHFPYPDNLVFRGITGNISLTGAKINRLEHSPDTPSSAIDTPVIKLFLFDHGKPVVITLPCDLVRSHRTGFGVRFLLEEMDPFLAVGEYYEKQRAIRGDSR